MPHNLRRSTFFLSLLLSPALAGFASSAAAEEWLAAGRDFHGCDACEAGKEFLFEHFDAYNAETGEDARNYPPDRIVDHLHMKLDMRFEDLNEMRFEATETLRVKPIGTPTENLTLDAVGLDISSVTLNGQPVEHSSDDETITLRFDPPLELDSEHEIVFEYICDHPVDGMVFTPYSPDAPHYSAEVHTQGQSSSNRHWFICHDYPNERMTTELLVDVPGEFSVSSNGQLVEQQTQNGRTTWHYLQDKPHVAYLVSLVIGQFDIVDIPHDRVPMRVWVPRGKGDQVMQTYGRTGEMIDLFEERFGVPYPWARYDQLVVKNFGAGGMENTSATSMYPTAILDETALLDGDLDGLIAHELAHQWSGDMYTCKDWTHIWLNEGFATYGSALWEEHRRGESGYLNSIARNMRRVQWRDRTTNEVGMVSPIYDDTFEPFRRAANPYPKGASILHMLRMMLGEEVFWDGIHLFMNRHKFDVVETVDLRYAMEEVSGRGLEWFFEQWCHRPGVPHLEVKIDYDGAARELTVDVEQTQEVDARVPAFRLTLPVYVLTSSGASTYEIEVSEKSTTFMTTLDGAPSVVAVDPWLHALARVNVEKPHSMWQAQVEHGPTVVARQRAIGELGESDNAGNRASLAELIRDPDEEVSVRNAAADALSGFGSPEAKALVRSLVSEGIEEAKVRLNLVRALRGHEVSEVGAMLAEIASSDASYDTRSAAISALADLEAKDHADVIVEMVRFESQHDDVRKKALDALADLDDQRGLELAIEYSVYGYQDRARPTAVSVIGRLGKHDADRAYEVLIERLHDPERRTVRAAGRALAELGDERAVDHLQRMEETHPDPDRRRDAERWLETLRDKLREGEQAKDDDSGEEGEDGEERRGRGGRRGSG